MELIKSNKKYRIGDVVKVKHHKIGRCDDGCALFDTNMNKYVGKKFKVISIKGNNRYLLSECGNWYFSSCMLTPVKKHHAYKFISLKLTKCHKQL